ncbi:MAG: 50S ribosomal protein L24 [Bacteroides sp.]|nr:MAG: 50S ribosomal protein L24 [Bacteroides sp.]
MKKNKKLKFYLKSGDWVRVITGNNKGKEGKILKIDYLKNKIYVTNINLYTKHVKSNDKNSKGKIVKKEMPLDISNVMIIDPLTKQVSRIGMKKNLNSGKFERYYKKSKSLVTS